MRFAKNWDERMLQLLKECPSPKPILTGYPIGYELPNEIPSDPKPSFMVAREFGKEGMLRLDGKQLTQSFPRPLQSYFWVSGFAFSRSEVLKEVPYDPHLPFLFFGEETQMNVRLWTHGWDFFAPGVNLLYHLWTRSYRNTFREVEMEQKRLEEKSLRRVKYLLGMLSDVEEELKTEIDKYSLGTTRTLEQYQEFTGINFSTQEIQSRARWGGLPPSYFLETLLNQLGMLALNQ